MALPFETLETSQRLTVFYGEALQSAFVTTRRSQAKDSGLKPVVIQITVKDQIRMAGFRVNFSGKYSV